MFEFGGLSSAPFPNHFSGPMGVDDAMGDAVFKTSTKKSVSSHFFVADDLETAPKAEVESDKYEILRIGIGSRNKFEPIRCHGRFFIGDFGKIDQHSCKPR